MKLIGKTLEFVSIDKTNSHHQLALDSLTKSGEEYLGNVSSYEINNDENKITGNDYLVYDHENIVGYLGLAEEVDTIFGKASSIYYGVLEEYYGNNYGSTILCEITSILKEKTEIKLLVANINKTNVYSLKTALKANFKVEVEYDDDIQFLRHI